MPRSVYRRASVKLAEFVLASAYVVAPPTVPGLVFVRRVRQQSVNPSQGPKIE